MPASKALTLLVPGSIETRTGGYQYDRRIAWAMRNRGWTVDIRELEARFPRPSNESSVDAARILAAIPDDTIVLVDGLAFGAMPSEVARESRRLRLVPIVHLPLAAEIGIGAATASLLEASERKALQSAAQTHGNLSGVSYCPLERST